jgi:hypothetical protein
LLVLLSSLGLMSAPPSGDDKLEVRRVLLGPEQLEQELRRLKEGVLVQLPRAELEEKLRQAQRQRERRPPILAEASYHAALQGSALVGSAQWKVIHGGPGPGLLPLSPLNLALRKALFENHEAVLGDFDGQGPALLVEATGEHPVTLDWSARGELRPDGTQFDLKLPATPLAVLELELPPDRVVNALDSTLVLEPHPPERPFWKVFCGGRTQVNLLLRPAPPGEGPQPDAPNGPLTLVEQRNTQRLTPEGVEATFALRLEVAYPGLRRFVVDLDPELRLRDLSAPDLEGYDVGTVPAGQRVPITVKLRSPLRVGTVVLSCLAPLGTRAEGPAAAVDWHSPGIQVRGGAPREEKLELWLRSDLRAEALEPGGFRVTGATPAPGDDGSPGQRLTLLGGGLEPSKGDLGKRPHLRCRAAAADFHVRQLGWWQLRPGGSQLSVQLAYEVYHGQLFQLAVQVPPDWQVDSVKMTPPRLLRNYCIRSSKGAQIVLVDLERPLAAESEAHPAMDDGLLLPGAPGSAMPADARPRLPVLSLELRPAHGEPLIGRDLAFPDVVPLGTRARDGALGVDVDMQVYRPKVTTPSDATEPDEEGPWGRSLPAYFYRFLGQPLTGHVRLEPRRSQLRARCSTDVLVASGRAVVKTQLLLQADAGLADFVDLHITGQVPEHWSWREEGASGLPEGSKPSEASPVRKMEHRTVEEVAGGLAALAGRGPLEAMVLAAARPPGQCWRLVLARPLRVHQQLRLSAASPLALMGGRWAPILLTVRGARMEGEVTLHLGGADLVEIEPVGLNEVAAASRRTVATAWRTYRYGPEGASLFVRSPLPGSQLTEAVIESAQLMTSVGPDGVLHHRFVFEVVNWQEDQLPIRLPVGSRLRAAQVDGRWVPDAGLPGGEPAGLLPDAGGVELRLPVPRSPLGALSSRPHVFEVLYTTPMPGGWLVTSVAAPAPRLPIEPTTFHRTWRLPPEVVPLHGGRLQRLPETGTTSLPAERDVSDLFRLPGVPLAWREVTGSPAQLQAIADAAQSLRAPRQGPGGAAKTAWSLREVVEVLAFEQLGRQFPLVVDTRALNDAGLSAASTLAPAGGDRPLWEGRGLAVVPVAEGTLLTTQRQLVAWGRMGLSWFARTSSEEVPADVVQAVTEAVAHGQGPSGRFRTALYWLRPDAAPHLTNTEGPTLSAGVDQSVWAEWAPVAGSEDATLAIVHVPQVCTAALLLTVLLIAAGWLLRRSNWRFRVTLLLLVLGVAGGGLVWLPVALGSLSWVPLVLGCVVGLCWFLRVVRRPQTSPARRRTAAAASGAVVLAFLAGWSAMPIAPAAPADGLVTVFLLPAEAPDKQFVLVPADFLERIKSLGRDTTIAGRKAVLVSATYDGKIDGDAAEISAVFIAQSLTDDPVPLVLPLDGVQLTGDVWLDTARAHPIVGSDGYVLTVKGARRHKVELRFRAPVVRTPEDRSVTATLPPVLQAHLDFHLPPGAASPQALVAQGAQGEITNASGKHLEADLGRIKTLQVRWLDERPGATPHLELRAAHLWDLRLEGSTLRTLVHYRITGAPVPELTVLLPPGLEVRSVEASRSPGGDHSAMPLRLRDRPVDPERRLHLMFTAPIAGDVDVLLELTPRAPLPAKLVLPLPMPQGAPPSGDAYLAYSLQGLEARRGKLLSVTGIRPEEFAPFWPSASRPSPRDLAYACTVGPNALLELHLDRPAAVVDAVQEVAIHAGTHQALVQAKATLTIPNRDVPCIEWELHAAQPLTVLRVTGPQVRTWSQNGDRAMIWLTHTVDRVQLELSAWAPLGPLPNRPTCARLDLPCLRFHPARSQQTTLRLVAVGDRTCAPLAGAGPQHLDVVAGKDSGGGTVYRTSQRDYGGAFGIEPVGDLPPEVKVLTLAELRHDKPGAAELAFTAMVELKPPRGELRRATVRLRQWDHEAELAAPGATISRPQTGPEGTTWSVRVPPGKTGPYRITLSGKLPLEEVLSGMPFPDVSVPEAATEARWVAVAVAGLTVEPHGALQGAVQPGRSLPEWPELARRLERGWVVWKVSGPEWQVRLTPQGAPDGERVRVLLCDRTSAVVDHRHWLHEAVYWVAQEAPVGHLSVVFPGTVRIVHLSVDGIDLLPVQPGPRGLWLPLSGRSGVRQVRLRWRYDPAEPVDRPNLTRLQMNGISDSPTLWTIYVPVGWEAMSPRGSTSLGDGAGRIAALDLHRASMEMLLSRALAKSDRDGPQRVLDSQRRFLAYCRHAEQALGLGADQSRVGAPPGQTLSEWLGNLRKDNRAAAREEHFEELLNEAERNNQSSDASDVPASDKAVPERPLDEGLGDNFASEPGLLLSWYSTAGAPQVHLKSSDAVRLESGTRWAVRWLVLLGVVWLTAMLPFLSLQARRLWPELLAAVGLWGWYLAGPTVLALFLVLLGAWGRLFLLVQFLRHRMRRRRAPSTHLPLAAPGP